jgi:hypothetical protein
MATPNSCGKNIQKPGSTKWQLLRGIFPFNLRGGGVIKESVEHDNNFWMDTT